MTVNSMHLMSVQVTVVYKCLESLLSLSLCLATPIDQLNRSLLDHLLEWFTKIFLFFLIHNFLNSLFIQVFFNNFCFIPELLLYI